MDQCHHDHQHPPQHEPQREPQHDPTLASCCQRDLAEQAQARKCLQRLQAADRSTARTIMSAAVLATPSQTDQQPASAQLSDLSCDDETELQHFRDLRLRQLKQETQQRSTLESQRHSVLTEVQLSQCQALIHSEPHLLCHIYLNGVQACEQLNEHLNIVAHEHLHVKIVFVRARQSTLTQSVLGAVPIPGLAMYLNRKLSGAAPLHVFGDNASVHEEQVDKWLRAQLVDVPSSSMSTRGNSSDEEMEDENMPCSLCGRSYPHEHIRSMYQGSQLQDDSDSDSNL